MPGKFVEIDRPVAYFMHEVDINGKPSRDRLSKTFNPFKPDEEARQKFLQDGTRSYASQIFQVTAIQSIFATEQTNSKIQYVQMNRPLKDRLKTSERIVDEHGNMIGDVPNIVAAQIARAYFMIAGDRAKSEIIIGHPEFAQTGHGVTQFNDLNEFQKLIEKAKKEHRLPLIMAVDTRNEPFYSDSGRGAAGGAGGGHVVTITDYIPGPPGKISFDNQWGSWRDHGKGKEVSVREMYMAAFAYRGAGHAWMALAKAARDRGQVDIQAEYELWRRARENQAFKNEQNRLELISGVGMVSDGEFIQLTLKLISDAEGYYRDNEDESSVQFDKQFQQDFQLLPKAIKRQIARSMHRSPILSTRTNMLIEQCK